MRVFKVELNSLRYTCNSYLILGDWNRISDLNTLIDPGADEAIIDVIAKMPTGCGKVPVEQIILTHNHFDHAAVVSQVKNYFGARVLAFADSEHVDEKFSDGQRVRLGDSWGEVLHTPGHSSDSVCIHCSRERILFSGDVQIRNYSKDGAYGIEHYHTLKKLSQKKVSTINSGHDTPLVGLCDEAILRSLQVVRQSLSRQKRSK
jgi:glyoxylase-like metal-dependent hydrolase (beta-lactamase superfamily II)